MWEGERRRGRNFYEKRRTQDKRKKLQNPEQPEWEITGYKNRYQERRKEFLSSWFRSSLLSSSFRSHDLLFKSKSCVQSVNKRKSSGSSVKIKHQEILRKIEKQNECMTSLLFLCMFWTNTSRFQNKNPYEKDEKTHDPNLKWWW